MTKEELEQMEWGDIDPTPPSDEEVRAMMATIESLERSQGLSPEFLKKELS